MEAKTINLTLVKSTKSTGVYDEVTTGTPPIVRGLHFPLWYVGNPAQQKIEITVKPVQ